METREMETMEKTGTEVIYNKTGLVIGTVTGSYVGGFVITTNDGQKAMLPFKNLKNYSVKGGQ